MRLDTARADRVTALALAALGLALLRAGYTMDRLEARHIHPASIPGLLPMILGAVLALCALLLFLGARDPDEPAERGSWRDAGVALAWSAVYALVLVGRVPFYAATAVYVAGFILAFDRSPLPRRTFFAVGFGIAAAAAIGALFRYAFLVRLP